MDPLIIALGVAAFMAAGASLIHRKLLGPNRRLEALIKEDGLEIDFGLGGRSVGELHTRRNPHGEASRGPLRFTLGDLESYEIIQRENGRKEERLVSAQAYVGLTTPGPPRPYRLANLRRGTSAWRLARDLLRPVDEIYDDKIFAAIPEDEDAAAATERAIDDLEILAQALTQPEDTLINWLAQGAWPARLDALLQHFPDHPEAHAAAHQILARPRPNPRGPSAAWLTREDATLRARAALALTQPDALWASALDPATPLPLRALALRAWPGPLTAAAIPALLDALPPTPDALVQAALPHLRAAPDLEPALLAKLPERATPTRLHLLAELGGPASLRAIGALLHTAPKDLDAQLGKAAKAALARLQARLPAAAQGGLALSAGESGGLAEAEPL